MRKFHSWDVDYCQFSLEGFKKPTKFFGSAHLGNLVPKLCDGVSCPNLGEGRRHLRPLCGHWGGAQKKLTYPIPQRVVELACGLQPRSRGRTDNKRKKKVTFQEPSHSNLSDPTDNGSLRSVESNTGEAWVSPDALIPGGPNFEVAQDDAIGDAEQVPTRAQVWVQEQIKETACWVRDLVEHPQAVRARENILAQFSQTVLSGIYKPDPPIRGPFGEATIWVKEDAPPVARRSFRLGGERLEAHKQLIQDCLDKGKMELAVGVWNLPSFPVQKANGKYRLVQDFRLLNNVCQKDGHPLPRIIDILHRQGKFQLWSKMDLVDGYHQMPLKEEHRHFTCTTTPKGVLQWKVLVMGLKNAGSQFQRMMEWVLADFPNVNPYIDDIIVGSSGDTFEDLIANHERDLLQVLERLEEQEIVCSPTKSKFFCLEVEFCGHILRDGKRSPAPGKLLPLQKWEPPKTITELRSFLGLTNHFSEYVPAYASFAAPLMAKLKINPEDGKKG